MNRLVMMVLWNIYRVPGAYIKLCRYAKHTDKYPEQERYNHIQYIMKQFIACTNSFAMDREDVRQSLTVINAAAKEVSAGRNYLIFPEGTRSKNGNVMGDFHSGSLRCAMKAKCPIVPIVFIDCYKVLDQKGSKPVSVQLHFLNPIPYEEYKDLKSADVANLVKERIQNTIDQYAG